MPAGRGAGAPAAAAAGIDIGFNFTFRPLVLLKPKASVGDCLDASDHVGLLALAVGCLKPPLCRIVLAHFGELGFGVVEEVGDADGVGDLGVDVALSAKQAAEDRVYDDAQSGVGVLAALVQEIVVCEVVDVAFEVVNPRGRVVVVGWRGHVGNQAAQLDPVAGEKVAEDC